MLFVVHIAIYFARPFGKHFGFFLVRRGAHLGFRAWKKSSWLQPGAFSFFVNKNGYVDGGPMVSQLGHGNFVEFEKKKLQHAWFYNVLAFLGKGGGGFKKAQFEQPWPLHGRRDFYPQ